jgi:hypothetical protein
MAAGRGPPGRCANGFTLVSAGGGALSRNHPPCRRVGGFLVARGLVDPFAQAMTERPPPPLSPGPSAGVPRGPEVDDEDRLGAGVVHPDDAHRGESSQR